MASLDKFFEYLEKLPENFDARSETLKDKIKYDAERKLLILQGQLTEKQKDELCKLFKDDVTFQKAIECLFWKSLSPPDDLRKKECNDKYFVTEELGRMNTWMHRALSAWLVLIGMGSILVLIGIWSQLELGQSKATPTSSDSKNSDQTNKGTSTASFQPGTSGTQTASNEQTTKSSITKNQQSSEIPKVTPQHEDVCKISKSWVKKRLYGTNDQIMFLIAFLAGMIGSTTHGISSLMDFRGNRRLFRSWSLWYFGLPIVGGMVSIIFYIVLRAGFVSTNSGANNLNPFGIAGVSVMVGLFTDKATTKLAEIFDTMFSLKTTTKNREGGLNPSNDQPKTLPGTSSEETTTK